MKLSKTGIILASIFLLVTLGMSISLQWTYGDDQWMWGFISGGMPWTILSMAKSFFAKDTIDIALSWVFLFGGYILNIFLLYLIGYGLEKLYKKFRS